MDVQRGERTPSSSSRAEELFLAWLQRSARGAGESFAALRGKHPEDGESLDRLVERYERARTTLSRLSSPPTTDESASSAVPRYEIRGEIARGGMGVVLEVYEPGLRRTLAMKRLVDAQGEGLLERLHRERRRSRLLAEAQILAQLDHPGVVPVIEAGEDARGELFFTMRRVRGCDFGAVIERVHGRGEARAGEGAWTLVRAVNVLLRVCEAVAYAHEKGVVHRDLKPSNVMVGRFGETYVMDWGLARARGGPLGGVGIDSAGTMVNSSSGDLRLRRSDVRAPSPAPSAAPPAAGGASTPTEAASLSLVRTTRTEDASSSSSAALPTLEGEVVGTPAYMPPEQASGRADEVEERADVYALGAMLYHLLAGRRPYAVEAGSTTAEETLAEVLSGPPEPLRRIVRHGPEELVAVAEKAMARERGRRYASVLALADDLRAWLEGRVVRAHKTGPIPELSKWIKRNRGAAAAIAVTLVALAAVAVVQTVLRGEVEKEQAVSSARAESLRREDYFNRIALAESAYEKGDLRNARLLLEGCPEDLRDWEWHHLLGELDTSEFVFEGGVPARLAFSADGCSVLGFAPEDRAGPPDLTVWDAATGRVIERRSMPFVAGYALSQDRKLAAGTLPDREVRIWDTETWQPVGALPTGSGKVGGLDFDPKAERLAVGRARLIEIWDVARAELTTLLDAEHDLPMVAWSPDGTRLYGVGLEGRISLWDVRRGELLAHAKEGTTRFTGCSVSGDGRWLFVSDWDKRKCIRDATTLLELRDLGRQRFLWGPSYWSADSSRLFVGDGPVVRVLEAGSWRELGNLAGHERYLEGFALDPRGARAVTSSVDGTVRSWNLERFAPSTDGPRAPAECWNPSLSLDGRWLAFCVRGRRVVELWSVADRVLSRTIPVASDEVSLALAPDGRRLAMVVHGSDLQVLATESGAVLGSLPLRAPSALNFAPDGERLSFIASDGAVSVWSTRTWSCLWKDAAYDGPTGWPGPMAGGVLSQDGALLVTLPRDGRVQLRDASTGSVLRESAPSAEAYRRAAFTRDGRTLYVASNRPSRLERWSVEPLQRLWSRELMLERPEPFLALSADERRVFTLGPTPTLDVGDAATGRSIASFATDGYAFTYLVGPGVGDVVITTSNRGVRFWSAPRGR